jgi:hypothetical protein
LVAGAAHVGLQGGIVDPAEQDGDFRLGAPGFNRIENRTHRGCGDGRGGGGHRAFAQVAERLLAGGGGEQGLQIRLGGQTGGIERAHAGGGAEQIERVALQRAAEALGLEKTPLVGRPSTATGRPWSGRIGRGSSRWRRARPAWWR